MGRKSPRKGKGPPPLPPEPTDEGRCKLCKRRVAALSAHHLIPKSRGGTETVPLCYPCHKTIHATFSNETLERVYNTIEGLRAAPDLHRYLRWVKRQPDRAIKVKKAKGRK